MSGNDFQGMDAAQIRALANEMNDEAGEIEVMITTLTARLEAAPWRGLDQQRFLDEWRTRHVAALRRVATGLQRAARQANEHARMQEWASGS